MVGPGDRMVDSPRITVCFFGITRSLAYTYASIFENVITPASRIGDVRLVGHFFQQDEIDNPRSGEKGTLDPSDYLLLKLDDVRLDRPDDPEVQALFDSVIGFGASWKNDTQSLRNLCQQLTSLKRVTDLADAKPSDVTLYLRPDMMYHDGLSDVIEKALDGPDNVVYLPEWQSNPRENSWNDRFAIIKGHDAITAYGRRGERAVEMCSATNRPLPAEGLVYWALDKSQVQLIPHRATRVRFDGTYRVEKFDVIPIAEKMRAIKSRVRHGGLRDGAIWLLKIWQALRYGPRYRDLRLEQLNGVARRNNRSKVDANSGAQEAP